MQKSASSFLPTLSAPREVWNAATLRDLRSHLPHRAACLRSSPSWRGGAAGPSSGSRPRQPHLLPHTRGPQTEDLFWPDPPIPACISHYLLLRKQRGSHWLEVAAASSCIYSFSSTAPSFLIRHIYAALQPRGCGAPLDDGIGRHHALDWGPANAYS